ncbi:hypothetical protein N0B31_00025 [Salinirubellus salinus]|uniref:Uncharacterized protein n=1 Tax=Salinirubellus salinus TaxID=1364945 RepID=A0A9E7R3Q9_9EURY|nr:hypothetical protein [Salinirubellus salinus]UWM54684.1 hypothetical protein N0B31_00025 [Salinirubellus salinus]
MGARGCHPPRRSRRLGHARSTLVVTGLFAFVSGGIVLNVIKEELPEAERGRFRSFFAGAVAYTFVVTLI